MLIVTGKVAAIVGDAEVYRRPLDLATRADIEEGIWRGMEDARQGEHRADRGVTCGV